VIDWIIIQVVIEKFLADVFDVKIVFVVEMVVLIIVVGDVYNQILKNQVFDDGMKF
jgi:hypothetical protein